MLLTNIVNRASFVYSILATLECSFLPPFSKPTETTVTKKPTSFKWEHPVYPALDENGTKQGAFRTDEEHSHKQMLQAGSTIVRARIKQELESNPSMAGPILRLAFHDAITRDIVGKTTIGGPNGSIQYEIEGRSENRGLSKPLQVIQGIYNNVRDMDLSLADTIALSGAAAVEYSGGPAIPIRLGRTDATMPDPARLDHPVQMQTKRSKVETTLPSAGLDSDGLRLYFKRLGFTEAEWVALCGAHDLGRHVTLLDMPKSCLKQLTRQCLEDAPVSVPFVTVNPDTLSNLYYQKLLDWNERNIELGEVAFIPTDVDMVVDAGLRKYVERYAKDEEDFFRNFTKAYQKLVDVSVTTTERY